jgi:hypothetical protein
LGFLQETNPKNRTPLKPASALTYTPGWLLFNRLISISLISKEPTVALWLIQAIGEDPRVRMAESSLRHTIGCGPKETMGARSLIPLQDGPLNKGKTEEKSFGHTADGQPKKEAMEDEWYALIATGPMKPEPMEGGQFDLIQDGLGNRDGMGEELFVPTIGLGNKATMGGKLSNPLIGLGRKVKTEGRLFTHPQVGHGHKVKTEEKLSSLTLVGLGTKDAMGEK